MKAITLSTFGDIENLQIKEIPVPEIAAEQVLVEVKSISINPVDVKSRQGKGMGGVLENGTLKSHVSAVFPFEEMGRAHLQVETGKTKGKVIVSANIR